jgi:RNA polymerase sigma-70 factor (ECF subfamily)
VFSLATNTLVFAAPRRDHTLRMVVVEPSSEQLLDLVADGDVDAFERLYEQFARPVYSLCVRILGDRGRAEDAAQETFAAIWRSASTFQPDRGHAAGWIFAIARHAATDSARRRIPQPSDQLPDRPDTGPLPDEQVVADHDAFRIHAALETLPASERDVLQLAYFEGLSQSEIADRRSMPLGTVKTRTRSGLRRLAAELGSRS